MNTTDSLRKKEFKNNNCVALKFSTLHFFKTLATWVVVATAASAILSNELYIIKEKEFIYITAIIVILFSFKTSYDHYKGLRQHLDIITVVDVINNYPTNKSIVSRINEYYREAEKRTDDIKVKIDLLKSFSPVPLIVFILTFLQGKDFSLTYIPSQLLSLSLPKLPDLSTLFVVIFVSLYAVSVLNSYKIYKHTNSRKTKFLIALEEAKECD